MRRDISRMPDCLFDTLRLSPKAFSYVSNPWKRRHPFDGGFSRLLTSSHIRHGHAASTGFPKSQCAEPASPWTASHAEMEVMHYTQFFSGSNTTVKVLCDTVFSNGIHRARIDLSYILRGIQAGKLLLHDHRLLTILPIDISEHIDWLIRHLGVFSAPKAIQEFRMLLRQLIKCL
ncbi:hypothetical protein MIND_00653700 [Mycena indigotica]|uniref:Uncharacterized protein n=1 Tax=Mycena indigotica TaxID=2126181 RepID=A0A8H6SSE6_9AGAR|nr:uncharacterized protein MIND_00653700 [Mycena indigotica]KAF7304215.1 hypothetical protein MIND_00653700 [Mycena indigotica]